MFNLLGTKTNVVLAPYSTYKIGGKADYFFIAKTKQELIDAVREAIEKSMSYFILGAGANILFSDKGYRGLVIKNEARDIKFDNRQVTAESGAMISRLIESSVKKGLSGLEHFAGIPSTVGGALWQNLHFLSPDRAKTIFIADILECAEVMDENSRVLKVDKNFFNFDYDYSVLHYKNLLVTEATFKLIKQDKEIIRNQIKENLKWRNEKQPQLEQFPSCGSVFKKIEGIGAGRLIEKVGLKGYRIGSAMISEKHANYIVNMGKAKSQDVLSLIKIIQDKVKSETGHELEPEVSFIGES